MKRSRRRVKHKAADDIAGEMMTVIPGDLAAKPGSEVLLLVNGYGGTPAMELYLMFDAAKRVLDGRGLKTARSLVGNYCTSLEMAGCSLTVTAFDAELTRLWDAPVHTAALRW
jgi:dihydroxyacetone kinase-like protein